MQLDTVTFTTKLVSSTANVVFHYKDTPLNPPHFCEWMSNVDDDYVVINLHWHKNEVGEYNGVLVDYGGVGVLPVEVEYGLRCMGWVIDL